MKRPELIVTILIVLTCVVLAGLVGVAVIILRPAPPPQTSDAVYTEVAQTIQAQLTMDALLTLLPPVTQVAPSATLPVVTPFPPTPTLTLTVTSHAYSGFAYPAPAYSYFGSGAL